MDQQEIDNKLKQMSGVRTLILYSIVSALALVVGLFWNDAIRATIEQIVPQGDSLFYKYVAAIIATLVVVVIVYVLMRFMKLREKALLRLQSNVKQIKERKKGLLRLR